MDSRHACRAQWAAVFLPDMQTPDFFNSPFEIYQARIILGVVIAFTITSTVSLVLRFLGKITKKTEVTAEDWLIIVAQIVVYALAAVIILEVVLGNAGNHATESPAKVPRALKILIAIECLYAASLGLVKISICVFYNRVSPFRSFQVASWITIGFITSWALAAIIYIFLVCYPLAPFWNPDVRGTCVLNKVAPYIAFGAVDIVIDVTIIIISLPLLWKLHVPFADKIALVCIFGAGICTMIMGILRIEAMARDSFANVTYTSEYVLVWSFAKPAIGVTVACAPFFRHLLCRKTPRSEIELVPAIKPGDYHHIRTKRSSFLSFADPKLHLSRKKGLRGSYITMQVLESGNWSSS